MVLKKYSVSHMDDTTPITESAERPFYAANRSSSPAAMAWLDRALQRLLRSSHPIRGMEAAADAREATRTLASTLGKNEVPFVSVERRIHALVRLEVPPVDDETPRRRRILVDQLLQWASEAYHETRLRLRKPADLP